MKEQQLISHAMPHTPQIEGLFSSDTPSESPVQDTLNNGDILREPVDLAIGKIEGAMFVSPVTSQVETQAVKTPKIPKADLEFLGAGS